MPPTSTINFPTLTTKVSRDGLQDRHVPNTISAPFEGGASARRPRHTRQIMSWSISMERVTDAEKVSLEDFTNSTVFNDALPFNWTHPVSGANKVVYFSKSPEYSYACYDGGHRWDVSYEVTEY